MTRRGRQHPPTWTWTVDLAMQRLAFGFADMSSDRLHVETLLCGTKDTDGARLAHIADRVGAYARDKAIARPPHVVFVEQPSGSYPKPQLSYACGVVQAVLARELGLPNADEGLPFISFPVWTFTSTQWKKWTVGTGNATKDQVAAWCREHITTPFASQDEADALCMAHAARQMIRANQWSAA